MARFRTGRVSALLEARPGLQRVAVDLGGPAPERAYALTGLVGEVAVGDEVVVNVTAVELGLGSGGWHVVHWNLARRELDVPGGGHVLKLRYTPLQADVGVAEEADGYAAPDDLGGRPVVGCLLHSQVAPVAAAYAAAGGPPHRRLVLVVDDSAALPLALSDAVAGLRGAGLLAASVTAGQAFGGDLEAVHVPSALDVAVGVGRADAVVVAPGPGVVGTASARGFGGLVLAAHLDAAARAGGRPVLAVRWSGADPRERHRRVSHHVAAVLAAAERPWLVAVPAGEAADLPAEAARHEVVEVVAPDVVAPLAAAGVEVATMGRSAAVDPGPARWAAAAGALAASLPSPG